MSNDAETPTASTGQEVPTNESKVPLDHELESVPPIVQLICFALLACIFTLVNRFVGMFVPLDKLPVFGQHVVATAYFAALLFALMRMTRSAALLSVSMPTLIVTGLVLATPMGTVLLGQMLGLPVPPWLILTANNLFLPVAVALIGTAVGRIIRHPNTLIAAAGFAIFFDIVIVSMGTVAALSSTSTGAQLISMVSVGAGTALPQHVQKSWAIITGVTIGPADVLFLSVFFASVFLLRLDSKSTFRWIFVFLLAALFEVEWIGFPVPALAPMGVAVILANRRFAAFTERERKDLVIGGIFACACAAFIVNRAQNYAMKARNEMLESRKKVIGIRVEPFGAKNAYVLMQVLPESRAAKAGLRPGDVVQKVNGIPIGDLAADPKKYTETFQNAAKNGIKLTIKSGDRRLPRDVIFPPVDSAQPDPTPAPPEQD